MSPELYQIVSALIALYGLVLCFAGYRVFRLFLAVGGFVAGLWLGGLAGRELQLEPLWAMLLAGGTGLLLAWLAAAVYYAGLFLAGGAACAGIALTVASLLGKSPSAPVFAGVFAVGGALTALWHRRLIVYLTAVAGGLLVMVGLSPLLGRATVPEKISLSWLQGRLGALTAEQLGIALVIAVAGVIAQRRWTAPGLVFSSSRAETVVLDEDARPPDRSYAPAAGRTHDVVCPRCGELVDPDALFCHRCGNDRWD
ncbi:MAG: zinc ribbon domain-containing protein [bacterium]